MDSINKNLDSLINPDYYKSYPVESIEMMCRIFGYPAVYNFCILNAFKYRMRLGKKTDDFIDHHKEQWYLKKAAEILKMEENE